MSESHIADKSLAMVLADLEPDEDSNNFRPYLKYLQQNVTVEQFLADRLAQANTDVVIGNNRSRNGEKGNPYPVVVINRPATEKWGHGTSWHYRTFMLSDDSEHIYFFSEGWPILQDGKLPYLRPEDVIPFEEYNWDKFPKHRGMAPGMDFTKPVERALIKGGEAERFNFQTKKWEVSGKGIAEPIRQKVSKSSKLASKIFGNQR